MALARHWVTCSLNPGVGGISFPYFGPFSDTPYSVSSVSKVTSLGLSPCRLGNPKAAAHVAVRPSVLVTVKR